MTQAVGAEDGLDLLFKPTPVFRVKTRFKKVQRLCESCFETVKDNPNFTVIKSADLLFLGEKCEQCGKEICALAKVPMDDFDFGSLTLILQGQDKNIALQRFPVRDANGKTVAWVEAHPDKDDEERRKAVALARLMTSAPKLLVALEHAYTRLNELPHSYRDTRFALMVQAIREAKGLE
ncbi:MAG: hypothetical protein ACD_74C00069G0006 [uncultured bacterium]|nr:MAG: hypothetical protein ACD_74C00069G0006 [uncultured bacterium]